MNKELSENKTKIKQNIFDKLFFIYVIIYSGAAISAVRTHWALLLLGVGSAGCLLLHKMLPRRSFWIACCCWMVYFALTTVVLESFHPYFMIEMPILMLTGYALVNIWGKEFFKSYSRALYILCLIALVFYVAHLILPGLVRWFIARFDCQGGLFTQAWRNCGSVIVYTINETIGERIPRNCGFCWEPGPFACFIVIALFFNYVILGNHSLKVNGVLIAALITTFSTTGYMMFGFLFLYYTWNQRNKIIRIGSVIAAIAAVIIFIQVDFLGQKVQDQIDMADDWSMLIENSRLYGRHYTPGRFISMKLALMNFEQRPLLGYAGNTQLEYSQQLGASVAVISGIGYIMARYGLFGLSFYLILLLASAHCFYLISQKRNRSAGWLWILLNLMIGVSFKLTLSPVFFGFLFCGFFPNGSFFQLGSTEKPDSENADKQQTPPASERVQKRIPEALDKNL